MRICIDFDGTLCENDYPEIGSPKYNIIQYAIDLQKQGAVLILNTCRENKLLDDAIEWCAFYGLEFDAVAKYKEYADAYVDDKSICVDDLDEGFDYDIDLDNHMVRRIK